MGEVHFLRPRGIVAAQASTASLTPRTLPFRGRDTLISSNGFKDPAAHERMRGHEKSHFQHFTEGNKQ